MPSRDDSPPTEQRANLATAGRGHGPLERVTVNLTPRSSRALEDTAERSGNTKTDTINRAIQVYGYLEEILQSGGAVYVREHPGDDLERLKFF
jgi:hypothetical protein